MIKTFSSETRRENIEKFKNEKFDLAIIGGGITGAGVARDAASRGMKVALVEMNDFASGTSSRSSKLVHGGIRYLENLEFHLVYEALSERSLLFELAPHLVHPLRFLLPIYKNSRVGMLKMGLGMWLYDILSTFEAPELHERLSVKESLHRMPILQNLGLQGSYVYSDAYMDDDRLVLETLRSANNMGASCANYVKVIGADFVDNKVNRICCRDTLGDQEFYIEAEHFVSTVGPWTDELAQNMLTPWQSIMRPSKGIHLTLSRERLPLDCAVVMASDDDNRIVFGIPRHEMVIIGTTDTDYEGDLEDIHSTKEDVDYLLEIVEEYFPGARLGKDDILASYAGVRPLVDDGSSTESGTSREHTIFSDPRNITFVAGGKYTTYRRMAEEAVEIALDNFSMEDRARFSNGNTKVPLNPLVSIDRYSLSTVHCQQLVKELNLQENEVATLLSRHGEEALHMVNYGPVLANDSRTALWQYEAYHAIVNTMCMKLRDFYLRRSPLFLARADHGMNMLEDIADVFAAKYSWTDERRKLEVSDLQAHINSELAWQIQSD